MTAILSVRDYLASFLGPYLPLRCGSPGAICGGARLGIGAPWPFDWTDTTAYCGKARCGAAHCGRIANNGAIFAGNIPAMKSHAVTLVLTEDAGGRPDPRQAYATAYDNPTFTLHIIMQDRPPRMAGPGRRPFEAEGRQRGPHNHGARRD